MLEITEVQQEEDLLEIRKLFEQYADSLEINLDFQGFEEELAEHAICASVRTARVFEEAVERLRQHLLWAVAEKDEAVKGPLSVAGLNGKRRG